MTKLRTTTVASLLLILTACAPTPREVEAPKNYLPTPEVRAFAFGDSDSVEFTNVTFFLWKTDVTPDNVKNVLRASNSLDPIEFELHDLKKILTGIEEQKGKLRSKLIVKNDEVYETISKPLKAAKKEKKTELAKPVEEQDKEKLDTLTKQIEDLQAKLIIGNEEIAKLEAEQAVKMKEFEKPTKDNEARQNDLESSKTELLSQVLANVDYREAPTSIAFKRKITVASAGGRRTGYDIKLNWNPDATEEREFSTQNGLASELKYTEKGGILEFVTQLSPTEQYQVRVVRVSYDDKLGREIYSGDLTYRRFKDVTLEEVVETRAGVAKLVREPKSN